MFLCERCGNKRCPHATNHRHACTGSNEPGQPGSEYGSHVPGEPWLIGDAAGNVFQPLGVYHQRTQRIQWTEINDPERWA